MTGIEQSDITSLIASAGQGDAAANDRLFTIVYNELRRIARAHRARWNGDETIGTTALIHEAYLKMSGSLDNYENRVHFFATASRAMRQILVNYAQRRQTSKRSGQQAAINPDELPLADGTTFDDVLGLHELLTRLDEENPRRARVVECRVFGGLTIDETAKALGVSVATVKRDWNVASAWLYREMQ